LSNLDRRELFSVDGKNVLITGGGRGIGQMMAQGFVQNGARVFICSRDAKQCQETAKELTALGPGTCVAIGGSLDLSSVSECKRLASELPVSQVHVLINNSAALAGAPVEEFSERNWDDVMNVNLKSVFFLIQACLPKLRAAASDLDPARIINVSSVVASKITLGTGFSYDTSKAALNFLTKKLAAHLARERITVNAIAPGAVPTKLLYSGAGGGPENDDWRRRSIPMGRLGARQDFAGTALFLSSPAGAWITANVLVIDGGWLVFATPPPKKKSTAKL